MRIVSEGLQSVGHWLNHWSVMIASISHLLPSAIPVWGLVGVCLLPLVMLGVLLAIMVNAQLVVAVVASPFMAIMIFFNRMHCIFDKWVETIIHLAMIQLVVATGLAMGLSLFCWAVRSRMGAGDLSHVVHESLKGSELAIASLGVIFIMSLWIHYQEKNYE